MKVLFISVLTGISLLIACATDDSQESKQKNNNILKPATVAEISRSQVPHKLKSFNKSKKLMKKVYTGRQIAFYSGCQYDYIKIGNRKKARVNSKSCGYQIRKDFKRGINIEWEHVVPAWAFGHTRKCWRVGNKKCKRKGRKCCGKVDPVFRAMESDLHNLQPAIGELNGDRKHFRFSMIPGEKRKYGQIDFEIDFKEKVVEPRPEIRGDIARTYFYMEKTYGVRISNRQRKLFQAWNKQDPVDKWEKMRNEKIFRLQGNRNPFI